jgi:hypothetical protein
MFIPADSITSALGTREYDQLTGGRSAPLEAMGFCLGEVCQIYTVFKQDGPYLVFDIIPYNPDKSGLHGPDSQLIPVRREYKLFDFLPPATVTNPNPTRINLLPKNKLIKIRIETVFSDSNGIVPPRFKLWIDGYSVINEVNKNTIDDVFNPFPIFFGFDVAPNVQNLPANTNATVYGENVRIYSKVGLTTRDTFKQPFSSESPWNLPLSTDTSQWQTLPTQLDFPETQLENNFIFNVGTTNTTSAAVWQDGESYGGPGYRCGAPFPSGTDPATGQPVYQTKKRIYVNSQNNWNVTASGTPLSYTIPNNAYIPKNNKNSATGFLNRGTNTYYELNAACRVATGVSEIFTASPYFKAPTGLDMKADGDGIYGSQGGTAISAIGGAIRQGELYGPDPIRHALKITLKGSKYYYVGDGPDPSRPAYTSGSNNGNPTTVTPQLNDHRWPAINADRYANASVAGNFNQGDINLRYGGTFKPMRVGALLALTQTDAQTLLTGMTVKTDAAKKIIQALATYGAYVVDDAGCDCMNLAVESNTVTASDGREVGVVQYEMQSHQSPTATGPDYPIGGRANDGVLDGSSGAIFLSDLKEIAKKLKVVDDNGSWSRGGAGTMRTGEAPAPYN